VIVLITPNTPISEQKSQFPICSVFMCVIHCQRFRSSLSLLPGITKKSFTVVPATKNTKDT
jgi:hypothetical protein